MVLVNADSIHQRLVRKRQIAKSNGKVSNVVPHLPIAVVMLQRFLKALQAEVILPRIVRGEPQVVPDFNVANTKLQQASVEPQTLLRMVCIEVVGRQTCDGFDVTGIDPED
ncbi:MAG: hypothetical protein V2I33_22365 [Kangiellaceae bacterium]|jgi:hypothetical protein|nr:hypothetical protein [Kangiellaceae bacterium]